MTTTDELYEMALGLDDQADYAQQELDDLLAQAEDAWQEYYDAEREAEEAEQGKE